MKLLKKIPNNKQKSLKKNLSNKTRYQINLFHHSNLQLIRMISRNTNAKSNQGQKIFMKKTVEWFQTGVKVKIAYLQQLRN